MLFNTSKLLGEAANSRNPILTGLLTHVSANMLHNVCIHPSLIYI